MALKTYSIYNPRSAATGAILIITVLVVEPVALGWASIGLGSVSGYYAVDKVFFTVESSM